MDTIATKIAALRDGQAQILASFDVELGALREQYAEVEQKKREHERYVAGISAALALVDKAVPTEEKKPRRARPDPLPIEADEIEQSVSEPASAAPAVSLGEAERRGREDYRAGKSRIEEPADFDAVRRLAWQRGYAEELKAARDEAKVAAE